MRPRDSTQVGVIVEWFEQKSLDFSRHSFQLRFLPPFLLSEHFLLDNVAECDFTAPRKRNLFAAGAVSRRNEFLFRIVQRFILTVLSIFGRHRSTKYLTTLRNHWIARETYPPVSNHLSSEVPRWLPRRNIWVLINNNIKSPAGQQQQQLQALNQVETAKHLSYKNIG